ncbi:hypothetical protein [Mailhella massiliensis]|uniref:hypothetical protein n=1 Tax=Mailhella massiliensis TaxID=1903261 RepID=UPI00138FF667|nr:hypothetical protein [Mailhella massiliensis]
MLFSFKKFRLLPEKTPLNKEYTGKKCPLGREMRKKMQEARPADGKILRILHSATMAAAHLSEKKTGNTLKRDNDAALFYILAVWST